MLTTKIVLRLRLSFSAETVAQTQPASDGAQQDASDPFHIKTTIVVTGTRTPNGIAAIAGVYQRSDTR